MALSQHAGGGLNWTLAHHWKMDEASGHIVDTVTGASSTSVFGTPTYQVANPNDASDFGIQSDGTAGFDLQWFDVADAASSSWKWVLRCQPTSGTTNTNGDKSGVVGISPFRIHYDHSSEIFRYAVRDDQGNNLRFERLTGSAPADSVHTLEAWWDPNDQTFYFKLNGGSVQTASQYNITQIDMTPDERFTEIMSNGDRDEFRGTLYDAKLYYI